LDRPGTVSWVVTGHGYNLSRINVLVVDDNAHMQMLVRSILDACGVGSVRKALDGMMAIDEMRLMMPDIVITDFQMTPMDGIELTKQVRSGSTVSNPYVPIIMMTGYTELHRVIEARDSGVTEIIAKPVSLRSLYSRIVAVIERPRPYIRTPNYFGPDRRRRQIPIDFEDRRLTSKQIRTEAEAAALPNAGADIDIDWD